MRRQLIGGILAAPALMGLSQVAEARDLHTDSERPPRFELQRPCPFEAASTVEPERVTCGYLVVPENRAETDSALLRIPVAIIKTTAENPRPDPLVFLHGGPGGAPLTSPASFKLFANYRLGADRDIILYNQRGSLMVEPDLSCDGFGPERRVAPYAADLTMEERDDMIADLALGCLDELAQNGRDLRGYSAKENAQDLKDLRQALNIESWNFLAVSYGTLMAVEAARSDPSGVRAMVLDSIVSPQSDLFMSEANRNFTLAVDRVLSACENDPECAAAFPDIGGQLSSVIEKLRNDPAIVEVSGPQSGSKQQIIVNWHDFLNLTHWMLYNERLLRLVPLLISSTNSGNFLPLTFLMDTVQPAPGRVQPSADGAFFAIVCRDQYSERAPLDLQPGEVGYGGFSFTGFMPRICAAMSDRAGRQPDLVPLESDIPTLTLTGRFDPVTNEIYARQVAEKLPRATRLTIPNYGHSTLSGYTACQTSVAADFLDSLEDQSGAPCLAELGSPKFVLSIQDAMQMMQPD